MAINNSSSRNQVGMIYNIFKRNIKLKGNTFRLK